MKYCAAPGLPSMRIDESVLALSLHSEIREQEKLKKVGRELVGSKLWSNSPTANSLNKLGESLISQQWERRNSYVCIRTSEDSFLVRSKNQDKIVGPIPHFHRTRTVKVVDGYLICDCHYQEQTGIVCRHCMSVLCFVDTSFKGVTHEDVSVVWWKVYPQYAYQHGVHPRRKAEIEMDKMLQKIRYAEFCGPSIPQAKLQCVRIEIPDEDMKPRPAIKTCSNYAEEVITKALAGMHTDAPSSVPISMMQEIVYGDELTQEIVYGDELMDSELPDIGDSAFTETINVSPYSRLSPLLKELSSLLEDAGENEIVDEMEELLRSKILAVRKVLSCRHPDQRDGSFIMVSAASSKRRKTHGTQHMKFW
jgi:hypothetical protein